jgi:hypothetical protein
VPALECRVAEIGETLRRAIDAYMMLIAKNNVPEVLDTEMLFPSWRLSLQVAIAVPIGATSAMDTTVEALDEARRAWVASKN